MEDFYCLNDFISRRNHVLVDSVMSLERAFPGQLAPDMPCNSRPSLPFRSSSLVSFEQFEMFWTRVTVVLQVSMKVCLLQRTGWLYLYDQPWEKKNYINTLSGVKQKLKEWTSFRAVCTTIICLAQLVGPRSYTQPCSNRTVNVHHGIPFSALCISVQAGALMHNNHHYRFREWVEKNTWTSIIHWPLPKTLQQYLFWVFRLSALALTAMTCFGD